MDPHRDRFRSTWRSSPLSARSSGNTSSSTARSRSTVPSSGSATHRVHFYTNVLSPHRITLIASYVGRSLGVTRISWVEAVGAAVSHYLGVWATARCVRFEAVMIFVSTASGADSARSWAVGGVLGLFRRRWRRWWRLYGWRLAWRDAFFDVDRFAGCEDRFLRHDQDFLSGCLASVMNSTISTSLFGISMTSTLATGCEPPSAVSHSQSAIRK